jgi:hypothetical protein
MSLEVETEDYLRMFKLSVLGYLFFISFLTKIKIFFSHFERLVWTEVLKK